MLLFLVLPSETSAFAGFVYNYDESGEVLYNSNGLKLVLKDLRDATLGKELFIYAHNTSSANLIIQSRDESVNDFMVSSVYSCEVCPNKYALEGILFLKSSLEENNITTIEKIEFKLKILNANYTTLDETDTITVNF